MIKIKNNEQKIFDVIRIYPENDIIIIYQPNRGKGCPIGPVPIPIPTDKTQYSQYSYDTLPKSYWKVYSYAYKVVNIVRSRTAKITKYINANSISAKCILYDTSPDFSTQFFESKVTIFHSKDGTIKMTYQNGMSILLDLINKKNELKA